MRYYADAHVTQPTLAIYYGKVAINILQSLRGNIAGAGDGPNQIADQSFVDQTAPAYRLLADLLIQQQRLGEAQQVLAMLKQQEFFEFTNRGAGADPKSDPRKTTIDLSDAEKALADKNNDLATLAARALVLQTRLTLERKLSAADQLEWRDIDNKLALAKIRFEAAEATLGATSDKHLDELGSKTVKLGQDYAALQEKYQEQGDNFGAPDRARLAELRTARDMAQKEFDARAADIARSSNDPEAQKRRKTEINDFSRAFQGTLKELQHDAVIAQYAILDDKVAIIFTTPNAVLEREVSIKREDLNRRIMAFRETLSDPTRDPLPQAKEMYQLLVAPIAGDLRQAGAKTLMLDLDDTLRYVPFAALHDGEHFVVENLSVVMVTEAVRDKLGRQPLSDWTVWGLGITKPGKDYDALPFAGVELRDVTGQLGGKSKFKLDGEFTEENLRDGLDLAYPVIHIASHFQFTSGSMDNSFLLLGDGSHLSLDQIKTKLDFSSVELLTLSACETAVGDYGSQHGTEVEGLGAIAQQSGAKAVLASLWSVSDDSTAILMRTLYEEHKDKHLDKADALREAQLALLKGTAKADESTATEQRGLSRKSTNSKPGNYKVDARFPYAHPYFWAPFILMGNWL